MSEEREEEFICKRSPSQVLNIKSFVVGTLCFAIIVAIYFVLGEKLHLPIYFNALLILPIMSTGWKVLQIKSLKYELTNERLKIISGVFNRQTDEIELYRIKDSTLMEPFHFRIFGLGNIHLETSDKTLPIVNIRALPRAREFREELRSSVEALREKKNVREVDFQ